MHALRTLITGTLTFLTMTLTQAAAPLWTFTPLTDTQFSLGVNDNATVQYTVSNQSRKIHTLSMVPIPGITQITTPGNCPKLFTLEYHQSCTLTLQVQGNLLLGDVIGGPVVCQQGNHLQCYQPSQINRLLIHSIQETPIQQFTITPSSGSNGSISPDTDQVVTLGGSVSFSAIPASGYGVSQWLLDGNAVQSGGLSYQLSNIMANHRVEVTFNRTTLSPSLSFLALSVNNTATNPALTGNTRSISIHNTGSEQAVNLQVSVTGLPSGTSINANSCSSTLNPGDYCTLAFTPGATASANTSNQPCTSGSAPVPALITVSSDNTPSTPIEVVVLGYGCIYQAGFVFAVDDSTPVNGSIGGTVLAITDQVPETPGIIWSSNGQGSTPSDAIYDLIYAIGETSTPSAPFPDSGQISGQIACNGRIDGACNSNNILVYYSPPQTNPAVNLSYYAAGQCKAYAGGTYTDWYLPAICQLGSSGLDAGCSSGTQNIANNLPFLRTGRNPTGCTLGNSSCFFGNHWSSTEYSSSPLTSAWLFFMNRNSQIQEYSQKYASVAVRCSRTLTV